MDYIQILGLVAAVFTTAANIPQTYKIIKTRSTDDISTLTYSLLLIGLLFWIVYGICQQDIPIIISNAVSAITCATILILKHLPKNALDNLHDTINPDGKNLNS